MTTSLEPVLPLVRAAVIEPTVCRRTALALAELQDASGGSFAASMATLATTVGMCKAQTRKHVHALVMMDVLHVVANAHGGAPGAVPHYQFNRSRLRALGQQPGTIPDMFCAPPAPRRSFTGFEGETAVGMAIEVIGLPGQRVIRFVRESDQGDIPCGTAPLRALLVPRFAKGAWTGWLAPKGSASEGRNSVYTPPETVELLQQWVQEAALGRSEGAAGLAHLQGLDEKGNVDGH